MPLAAHELRGKGDRGKRMSLSTTHWTDRVKERLIVEATSSVPAAVIDEQTVS